MNKSWNKGETKYTHPSVMKISRTMKRRKIDNFFRWRVEMKYQGKIMSKYPELRRNGDLAELIGVVLGDGHIEAFPRTECLYILSNSNNKGFVRRYSEIVHRIFGKMPTSSKLSSLQCIRIRIYQKNISKRLGIPIGVRKDVITKIPTWILRNKSFMIRYLRGLYEAEGSVGVHVPTGTYKLFFTNSNASLRLIVVFLLERFGFHPHVSGKNVQLSRKTEVERCIALIQFRKY
jgi:intein/homing endonuclease